MLITAASGLERLMIGGPKDAIIRDSNVAQISAALYYQSNVISKLTTSKAFKNKFKKTLYTQINKDFGEYMDAQARIKPRSLHHVYEWKKAGNAQARLFKLNMIDTPGVSFKVDFEFKPSKSPVPAKKGRRRHVFINKASVMEAGMPLIIAPRAAERLVFETDTGTVFMPKGASVTVKRPGGSGVKNQFTLYYSRWFSGDLVNQSIKRSGFQQIFNLAMTKSLKLPASIKRIQYSFSPNSIKQMADSSVEAAFGGSMI
jgi:hypothetical protein